MTIAPALSYPAARGSIASRRTIVIAGLAVALAVVFVLAVSLGPVSLPPMRVIAVILDALGLPAPVSFDARDQAIVMAIRLPRACLGVLVGVGLAISGALLQGLFRNPLADPGLIGVSAGAQVAAVATIVLGGTALKPLIAAFGAYALPVAAVGGCLGATALIYRLSTIEGRTYVTTMLLAGIGITALASAGTGLLMFMSDDRQLRDITFWSLGSLGGATWSKILATFPFVALCAVCAPWLARSLNALMLGEREAAHLGFNVQATKMAAIGCVALGVGASVAVAGIIGFVGLIVPHLVRLAIGSDHRGVLPGAALLGAALLLIADLVARVVVVPAELPIGVVTSALGAPFFLWLLLDRRRDFT